MRAQPGSTGSRSGSEPAATLAAARALSPWLIEIRRDLHRHPELGLEEHRTAGRVQSLLDELGIQHRDGIAQTGVLGTIEGARPGPCVALRADLDALPLQDRKDVPYRSLMPGKMHACGHDVHTAILLGAARLLAERRRDWSGTVKLLFQPAEETVGGARMMIEEGALEEPPVEAIFGLHVDPTLDAGQIGVRYGQRNASSDDVLITVHGRSAHGAYPATGVDAIVVAAQVVLALQTVISRNLDARSSAVLTIGTVRGGTQGNIVANRVDMVGTVRALEPESRQRVLARVREVATGVATGVGGSATVETRPSYDPLVNDDSMVSVVQANAERLLGRGNVTEIPRPSLGVEDFAFYVTRVPGAFYSLGVRNEAAGIVHPLHNELFDVDEGTLAIGAALQTLNALSILRGEAIPQR
jgi:amidohydrolase